MTDFAAARENMVDCQVEPRGVIHPGILSAFRSVPRELFIAPDLRSRAYSDEEIPVGKGRFVLEPSVQARMIQALNPSVDDVILNIGDCTGYVSAVLCTLVKTVITLFDDAADQGTIQETWNEIGACNIVAFEGQYTQGYPQSAPYDLVLVNGAFAHVPAPIIAQLSKSGRLCGVHKQPDETVGHVILAEHGGGGRYSSYSIMEASCPYLSGFEPEPIFAF